MTKAFGKRTNLFCCETFFVVKKDMMGSPDENGRRQNRVRTDEGRRSRKRRGTGEEGGEEEEGRSERGKRIETTQYLQIKRTSRSKEFFRRATRALRDHCALCACVRACACRCVCVRVCEYVHM